MKISLPLDMPAPQTECTVRFSKRRSLAIYVYPDLRVEVRAPHGCPESVLRRFVAERADWVRRKQEEFVRRPGRPGAEYHDGAPQFLLGQRYVLSLVAQRPYGVWLAGDQLVVRAAGAATVPAVLGTWYRTQAATVLAERLAAAAPVVARLAVPMPSLRLRLMRSRWGSCSSRGGVTLNIDLVRYPSHLIDYVIVHELCHLREFNHGAGFYRLMAAALPDWQQRKRELRELAATMPPFPR